MHPNTCKRCGRKNESLDIVRDFRGNGFALTCWTCRDELNTKLNRLDNSGVVNGKRICSPYNTPTVTSEEHLDKILASQICPKCNVNQKVTIAGKAYRCLNCGTEWNKY